MAVSESQVLGGQLGLSLQPHQAAVEWEEMGPGLRGAGQGETAG